MAAAWCDFLEENARKVYALAGNESRTAAHALAAKIKDGVIENDSTVRAIYRRHWSGLETQKAVLQGRSLLEDLGWLRVLDSKTGGRPSELVKLHPQFRKELS